MWVLFISVADQCICRTTLSSTVFFTVTSDGQTTTSAPSAFTSTLTSTNSEGEVSTITQIVVNPTLSSGGGGGNSEYVSCLVANQLTLTVL